MNEILADTSVLIDFFQGISSEEAKRILNASEIAISILTYLEVCRFCYKTGKTSLLEVYQQRLKSFRILGITTSICDDAARISHTRRMSMADAVIYATARENGLRLATSDSDLKGLEGVIFLKPKK